MLKPYVTPSERIRKSNVARAGFCTEENRGRILFVVDTSQAYRIVNNNQSPTAIAMNQWRISLEDGNFRHRAAFTTGFPAAGLTGMIVVSIAGCAGTRLTTGCAGAMRSMDSPSCVELSALGEGGNAGVEPLTDSGAVEIWSREGGLFKSFEDVSRGFGTGTIVGSPVGSGLASSVDTIGVAMPSEVPFIRSGGTSLDDLSLEIRSDVADIRG